jgi:hypothetical protein
MCILCESFGFISIDIAAGAGISAHIPVYVLIHSY